MLQTRPSFELTVAKEHGRSSQTKLEVISDADTGPFVQYFLHIYFQDDCVVFQFAKLKGHQQGEENVECEYQGEEIDIAFNVNYLQEILSTLDSEKIEINFFGSEKSCLITDPNSNDLKYVVMPLLI